MSPSHHTPKDKARSARDRAHVELDAIYETAPVGLCLLDTDTRYLRVNQRFADIDGRPIEEHIGKRVRDLVPGLADAAEELMTKVVETGEPILDIEISGETPAHPGVIRYWKESWRPIKDDRGQVFAINIVAEDITEYKRAKEALQESEERFHSILDNSQDIQYRVNMKTGQYDYISRSSENISGYTTDDLVLLDFERSLLEVHPDDLPAIRAELARMGETGTARTEYRQRTKKGDYQWVSNRASLIKDADGQPLYIVGSIRDITDRKRAAEALKKSEERFRALIENASDIVILLDHAGTITYASPSVLDIGGYNPSDLIGMNVRVLVHPDDMLQVLDSLNTSASSPGRILRLETRIRNAQGIWRLCEITGRNLLNIESVQGIVVNVHDITEQKQAEEEREIFFRTIADERALLQSVLEQLPVGVIIAEAPSGNLILANQRMKEIWGVPFRHQGSVLQDWEYRGFHLDWRPYTIKEWPLVRSLTTGEVVLGEEIEILRGDGTQGAVRVSSAPVRDATGTVRYGVVVFVDITERKQAEEALRESQQRFVTLFHHTPSAISLAKLPDGTIVDVNQAWVDLYGYTRDEAVGRTSTDLGIIRDREGRKQSLADLQHQGSIRNLESTFCTKSGTACTILLNMDAITLGGKRYLLSTMQDITERKRAEEAFKERDEQLRNLIARSKDGIIITDEAGRITTWNQGMEDITGLAASDAMGVPAWEVQSRIVDEEWAGLDYRARYRATWETVLREGAYQYSDRLLDVQVRTPNGDVRYIQQSVFTTQTSRGFLVGSILRDMTTQRRGEEQLRKTIEDLQRSNDDLERFAYISSHDLQEPIRAIVSFTQLLERRYKGRLDPDADEYIRYLVSGGKRMQQLVQDLLEFSRVNTTGAEFRPTDTTAIVEDALAVLHSKAQENGAAITYDPLPRVIADATQLRQVFSNLICNAIKYRKPDVPPEIHISAQRQEDMVQFSVADNGIGIEPQYFDRIFVIFQRLHGMDQYEGTGIGLAIVKRIIDRHGGRIWVESEPGKGSTFHFTIPAVKRGKSP
jgi:PAS domain S-box-containing protein